MWCIIDKYYFYLFIPHLPYPWENVNSTSAQVIHHALQVRKSKSGSSFKRLSLKMLCPLLSSLYETYEPCMLCSEAGESSESLAAPELPVHGGQNCCRGAMGGRGSFPRELLGVVRVSKLVRFSWILKPHSSEGPDASRVQCHYTDRKTTRSALQKREKWRKRRVVRAGSDTAAKCAVAPTLLTPG